MPADDTNPEDLQLRLITELEKVLVLSEEVTKAEARVPEKAAELAELHRLTTAVRAIKAEAETSEARMRTLESVGRKIDTIGQA